MNAIFLSISACQAFWLFTAKKNALLGLTVLHWRFFRRNKAHENGDKRCYCKHFRIPLFMGRYGRTMSEWHEASFHCYIWNREMLCSHKNAMNYSTTVDGIAIWLLSVEYVDWGFIPFICSPILGVVVSGCFYHFSVLTAALIATTRMICASHFNCQTRSLSLPENIVRRYSPIETGHSQSAYSSEYFASLRRCFRCSAETLTLRQVPNTKQTNDKNAEGHWMQPNV